MELHKHKHKHKHLSTIHFSEKREKKEKKKMFVDLLFDVLLLLYPGTCTVHSTPFYFIITIKMYF